MECKKIEPLTVEWIKKKKDLKTAQCCEYQNDSEPLPFFIYCNVGHILIVLAPHFERVQFKYIPRVNDSSALISLTIHGLKKSHHVRHTTRKY